VRAGVALVVAAGIAAVLAGCSGSVMGAQPSAPTSTPTASAPASGRNPPSPSASASASLDYDSGEPITPDVASTWDPAARSAAVACAQGVVTAFARPNLDATTWWAGLSPLLSARAQLDYSGVDPAAVPAHVVTGAGVLVDDASASVARVEVPTDAGTYTVVVSRIDSAHPWLAEQIRPPAGTH
jgi:hypothetical protein